MSNSAALSKQQVGTALAGTSAAVDEILTGIVKDIAYELSETHRMVIDHTPNLTNQELYEHLTRRRPKHRLHTLEASSYSKPDGGYLVITLDDGRRLILLGAENKYQGTPGAKSRGNAIERSGKNIDFCETWMAEEKSVPYVVFCFGRDFEAGSYIRDRAATLLHSQPLDTLNFWKDEYDQGGASIFTKADGYFDPTFITDVLTQIAELSIEYYTVKYGNRIYRGLYDAFSTALYTVMQQASPTGVQIDFRSDYLTTHLITYLGNKRALLPFINQAIEDIKQDSLRQTFSMFDGFSGSGSVARLMKYYATELFVNDMEHYSTTLNRCYLANRSEVDLERIEKHIEYLNKHK